jgi:hypothetical protein
MRKKIYPKRKYGVAIKEVSKNTSYKQRKAKRTSD